MLRTTPVYVLGDSHVLIYADRVAERCGETFLLRALYCRMLRAAELTGASGELDARVVANLRSARLMVDHGGDLEPFHRTRSRTWRAAAVAEDRRRAQPAIVLACGSMDVLALAANLPWDDVRLAPGIGRWFDVPACCAAEAAGAAPAHAARAFVRAHLEPFRAGLRRLRALGFANVVVLSVPPLTVKSDQFRAIGAAVGPAIPARRLEIGFRYKLALLVNDALRAICVEEGVPFVNGWNAQTVRGLARPALLNDGIHVDRHACETAITALLPAVVASRQGVALGDAVELVG